MADETHSGFHVARDAAILASLNAHRLTSGWPPLPSIQALRQEYKDDMQKRWLAHEERKVDAALAAFEEMKARGWVGEPRE